MRRQKGTQFTTKAKSNSNVPEEIIQAEIVQYLQSLHIFRHSVPNEAAGNNAVKTMQLISTGLWAGAGDLIVWWPKDASYLEAEPADINSILPTYPVELGYVEVKRPVVGKQSKRQQSFQRRCKRNGVPYLLAYSVEDIKAELIRRKLITVS